MIELKKCNFITGDPRSVSFGVHSVLSFLELEGRNIMLLCKPKTVDTSSSLKYIWNVKKEFTDFFSFKKLLKDNSALFRIDLLVVDLWSLRNIPIEYKQALDETGIQYIILSKQYHYTSSEDIGDFHIQNESDGTFNSKYTITDKVSGWSSSLEDLKKSYIRDKRIDGIIGDEEI